jgi:uncharacterized protein YkwD
MFNRKLLEEINSLRTNPSGYAKKILKLKNNFEGDIYKLEDGTKIKTQEGAAAYEEAANFLQSAQAVGKLTSSKGLTRIAEELLENIQRTDPDNLDSIDMNKIVSKFGDYSGAFGRIMEFGGSSPQQIVTNIVVCDGDKSRSQRENIMNGEFKVAGLALGDHKLFRKCTTIIACTAFKNTRDHDDYENY